MNIQELRDMLTKDIVSVSFTKRDGSTREMLCTTMKEYLPGEWLTSEEPLVPASESVVTVWDLEQQGWRSFRFDSIKSIFTDYFNYVVES
jgi:hypothetical protein